MDRLFLDVSTTVRWCGPPVGIARTEHALAMHALHRRPDVTLCLWDAEVGELRSLAPAWQEVILDTSGVLDTGWIDVRRHRPAWRNAIGLRHHAVMALERWRVAPPPRRAALANTCQALLLGADARKPPFGDAAGRRARVVPYRSGIGPPLAIGPGDTVLSAGVDWFHKGTALVGLQRRLGFRLAVNCFDLLPLRHPEWFHAEDVPRFDAYWRAVIPAAARILCNARCVAQELRDFAADAQLGSCAPVVVPLGFTPVAPDGPLPPLPAPLASGRYAMFVSTVEPRKNHATLIAAWRALLNRGQPQAAAFDLVLVGRRGWKVAALQAEIDALAANPTARLHHFDDADDALLARLYRDAAFCVYPSRDEGFGLPVIEAMALGKAVIASNGGAVAETAEGLAPCLDPLDIGAWTDTLGAWIAHPAARAPWEARIAANFRYRSWPEAAEGIFQAAMA